MASTWRTEAHKRRLIRLLQCPTSGPHLVPEFIARQIRRLPVIQKDKAAQAALIKELLAVERQYRQCFRRYSRAANRLERLTMAAKSMPPRW